MKIGLFGSGAYGMALSSILVHNRCEVTMWTKFEKDKEVLETTRRQEHYIPDFEIDESIKITTSVEECIREKDLIIIAIPAAFVDSLCESMKPFIQDNHILIATKGIEQGTGLFINEIVAKHLDTTNIAVISGPSFAVDIVTKKPVGLSLASAVDANGNPITINTGAVKTKNGALDGSTYSTFLVKSLGSISRSRGGWPGYTKSDGTVIYYGPYLKNQGNVMICDKLLGANSRLIIFLPSTILL